MIQVGFTKENETKFFEKIVENSKKWKRHEKNKTNCQYHRFYTRPYNGLVLEVYA